ncbi:MAG: hypothetical protein QM778_00895 [Myxococcales bacterium]
MEHLRPKPKRTFFAFAAVNPLADAHDTELRISHILPGTPRYETFMSEARVRTYLEERGLKLSVGDVHMVHGRERIIAPEARFVDPEEDLKEPEVAEHHDKLRAKAPTKLNYRMRLGELAAHEAEAYMAAPSERPEATVIKHGEVIMPVNLAAGEQRQFIMSAPILRDEGEAYAMRVDHYALLNGTERYIGGFNVLFVPKEKEPPTTPLAQCK